MICSFWVYLGLRSCEEERMSKQSAVPAGLVKYFISTNIYYIYTLFIYSQLCNRVVKFKQKLEGISQWLIIISDLEMWKIKRCVLACNWFTQNHQRLNNLATHTIIWDICFIAHNINPGGNQGFCRNPKLYEELNLSPTQQSMM